MGRIGNLAQFCIVVAISHGGMAKRSLHHAQLLQVLQDNAKAIERLGWKNNDCEEFAEGQLKMLKGFAALGYGVKKTALLAAIPHAKLAISSAEGDLLCEKIKNTFSYIKRKLRYCGSGKFLPSSCQQVLKVWSRYGKQPKRIPKGKTSQENEKDVEQPPKPIRETLGLPPKKKADLVEVLSSDDDNGFDEGALPAEHPAQASGSSSSTSTLPSHGSALGPSCPPPCQKKKRLFWLLASLNLEPTK